MATNNTHDASHPPAGETQVPKIYSISIIFVLLSTTVTGLRVYTRRCILHSFSGDDLSICIAQVLAIAVSALTILGKQSGLEFFTAPRAAANRTSYSQRGILRWVGMYGLLLKRT
jgi:hypothetical protein